MKYGVVGSRGFSNYDVMARALDNLGLTSADTIVSGGAYGADALAEKYANAKGLATLIFKADWQKHGKKAGILRNQDIVDNSDVVIAFWDGVSRGTNNTINRTITAGKKLFIFDFAGNIITYPNN